MKLGNFSESRLLLGVGAQRSGTTWLSMVLSHHPEILFTEIKELHFFGSRKNPRNWAYEVFVNRREDGTEKSVAYLDALGERTEFDGKIENYRAFFSKRWNGQPYFGEITPAYMHLKKAELAYIRDEFPNAKILFFMRDPVARLWSALRFDHENLDKKYINKRALTCLGQQNYALRSDYKTAIENFDEIFGAENIFYGFYENLFAPATLQKLADFLEIAPFEPQKDFTINSAKFSEIDEEVALHLRAELDAQYRFVEHRFQGETPSEWLF